MIIELRNLRQHQNSKMQFIFQLQKNGKISKIIDEDGYVCYDTDEYEKYTKCNKKKAGRPVKIDDKTIVFKK